MRLFEAILNFNERWARGDTTAAFPRAEYSDSLPIVAWTCVDGRLDPFFPQALGIEKSDFIALRTPGNIISSPLGGAARSVALACGVKHAHEVVVLGHTDCAVANTTVLKLTDAFAAMGVRRDQLPDDLTEFFGLFASERQNVIQAVEQLRKSPLIGANVPVHGLLMDTQTGRLEWIVNGYAEPGPAAAPAGSELRIQARVGGKEIVEADVKIPSLALGEMKFPDLKIGEVNVSAALQQSATHAPHPTPSGPGAHPVEPHTRPESVDWLGLLKELATHAIRVHVIGNDMKPYGPVPIGKLLEWVVEKRIGPNTPTQVEGATAWQPLSILVKALKEGHLKRIPPLTKPKGGSGLFGSGRKT